MREILDGLAVKRSGCKACEHPPEASDVRRVGELTPQVGGVGACEAGGRRRRRARRPERRRRAGPEEASPSRFSRRSPTSAATPFPSRGRGGSSTPPCTSPPPAARARSSAASSTASASGTRCGSCRCADGFRVRLGDFDFPLPNDYAAIFERLAAAFPARARGAAALPQRPGAPRQRLRAPLRRGRQQVAFGAGVPAAPPRLPEALRDLDEGLPRAASCAIPRLAALLFQCSVFMGIPADEFPAVNFMMMFHVLFGGGLCTIAGGGQA